MLKLLLETKREGETTMAIYQEVSDIDMISRLGKYRNREQNRFFHWHENIEIIYIQEGSMNILIDGTTYCAKVGDLIVVPSRSIHCFMADKETMICWLCQFPLKILLNEGSQIESVKPLITKEEIIEDETFSQQLSDLFRIIRKEGSVKKGEKNIVLQCLFSALYFLLMRKFPKEEQEQVLKKEKREFYEIVEYINNHYTEDITVQNLAETLFMSRGKLSRLFEKYSGTGIPTYINTLRINHANHLLEAGKSITETAYECGFPSTRTFNNIYKKTTNMTPSDYIKKKKGR